MTPIAPPPRAHRRAPRRLAFPPALGPVSTAPVITSGAPGAAAAPAVVPAPASAPAVTAAVGPAFVLPNGASIDVPLNAPVTGAAQTAAGTYLVAADGGVFTFGSGPFFGSMGGRRLNRPIVGMAATPSGRGYWLIAADGGVFNFGDAPFLGSMGNRTLNRPIVGGAATPSGRGYWLVAADGGIFSFGDAPFLGSLGSVRLNSPIVAMAASPAGTGYWMVAADGGVFAFGRAPFAGSASGRRLAAPVTSMAPTASGNGYWLGAADGGVFSFGDAPFFGAPVGAGQGSVVAITPVPGSYRLVTESGVLLGPGDGGVRAASLPAVITAGVVNGINADRIANGEPPLSVDPRLSGLAGDWSRQMAAVGLQHRDLPGLMQDPSWPTSYAVIGEVLYAGDIRNTTAGAVISGWRGSPSHQQTVCDRRFNVLGVGVTVVG